MKTMNIKNKVKTNFEMLTRLIRTINRYGEQ